jgi:hypothetical protein
VNISLNLRERERALTCCPSTESLFAIAVSLNGSDTFFKPITKTALESDLRAALHNSITSFYERLLVCIIIALQESNVLFPPTEKIQLICLASDEMAMNK